LGFGVGGAIVVALLGATASASTSAPKAQDVTAARSVIGGIARFDQAALARRSAQTAAAQALIAQAQQGCAGAIPASAVHGTATQQTVVQDILTEGAFDVAAAVNHPIAGLARAQDAHLAAAHFSSRALTRALHNAGKAADRALHAMRPTDLCADVTAAAAGGFASDPPGTTEALSRIVSLEGLHALALTDVTKKLRPYLTSTHDRGAVARVTAQTARYEKFSESLQLARERKLVSVLDG
jgi:hypothetical protein